MPKFLNRKATQRLATRADIALNQDPSSPNRPNLLTPVYQPSTRVPASEYALKTPSKVKKGRLPGTIPWIKTLQLTQPDLLSVTGQPYHQNANLPWVAKRSELEAEYGVPVDGASRLGPDGQFGLGYDENYDGQNLDDHPIEDNDASIPQSRHRRKKENQCHSWINVVIPRLVPILMDRNSLRPSLPYLPQSIQCPCRESTQSITITCLYWTVITTIDVTIYPCKTIPELLVKNGLFPCSPSRPTLAIYTDILEFFHGLHAYQAPNITAISQTFIDFFKKRKGTTLSVDSLRRRFSAALLWYSVLDHTVNKYVDNIVNCFPNTPPSQSSPSSPAALSSLGMPSSPLWSQFNSDLLDDASQANPPVSVDFHSHAISSFERGESDDIPLIPWPSPEDVLGNSLGRHPEEYVPDDIMASYYLQSRCPCCFGGPFEEYNELENCPSVIVQLDANFGQKRRHGQDDAKVIHPYTKFLAQHTLDEMEEEVNRLRPPRKEQPDKRRQKNPAFSEDQMEATGLPTSVLDACEATFEAADSRCEKASTQFFSDTGLMAIICRHDIVLFLANMKSAGEKQFYALALIKAVFDNLPKTATMGILYDIGCQLHRSIIKWNFLVEFQDRMIFGLSVFHAYGHEWPCQVVYNPRKRHGFGLSNGEGCERLWSVLKELIPNLRVSGFYKRFFTLDNRIQSRHDMSLWKLGHWLRKTYTIAENKLLDNQKVLDNLGLSEEELQMEWEAQIKAQTLPLPSQSKNRAQKVIQTTLYLRQELSQLECERSAVQEARDALLDGPAPNLSILDDLESVIEELSQRHTKVSRSYQNRLASLGANEREELQKLIHNEYLVLRMNLRAKKHRIRERLRRRKMELATLSHSGAHSINRSKLVDHSEKMINRREPTIIRLVTEYNKGCERLKEMIAKGGLPHGLVVIAPERIETKRLFSIEVDDSLWQDVGLEDDTNEVPHWIGDDDVQLGIRAMLEKKRAQEEMGRIEFELKNLQSWVIRAAQNARRALAKDYHDKFITTVGDELIKRMKGYVDVFEQWSHDVGKIPGYDHTLLHQLEDLVPLDLFQPVRPGELTMSSTTSSVPKTVNPSPALNDSDGSDIGSDHDEEDDEILDTLDLIAVEEDRWRHWEFVEESIVDSQKRPRLN